MCLFRRRKIVEKIRSLCREEKCDILNELIAPFGYCYIPSQDIFTTQINAWQREFGYCLLYDRTAVYLHMVFDYLPVYFDYEGRTWMIEFWKGQYGIHTGCEIGVYYADCIINKEARQTTLFQSVADEDMPGLSFRLFKNTAVIAHLSAPHWWLTAFVPGCFSEPGELSLSSSLSFKSREMALAFEQGLRDAGCSPRDFDLCCSTVAFTFRKTASPCGAFDRFYRKALQWSNRFWCRAFLLATRPFCLSADRILYLYNYLPFLFRRALSIRKHKKRRLQ